MKKTETSKSFNFSFKNSSSFLCKRPQTVFSNLILMFTSFSNTKHEMFINSLQTDVLTGVFKGVLKPVHKIHTYRSQWVHKHFTIVHKKFMNISHLLTKSSQTFHNRSQKVHEHFRIVQKMFMNISHLFTKSSQTFHIFSLRVYKHFTFFHLEFTNISQSFTKGS